MELALTSSKKIPPYGKLHILGVFTGSPACTMARNQPNFHSHVESSVQPRSCSLSSSRGPSPPPPRLRQFLKRFMRGIRTPPPLASLQFFPCFLVSRSEESPPQVLYGFPHARLRFDSRSHCKVFIKYYSACVVSAAFVQAEMVWRKPFTSTHNLFG